MNWFAKITVETITEMSPIFPTLILETLFLVLSIYV